MKIDFHCHAKEGSLDAKVTLRETIISLKEKGYQGMVITDHNTHKAYRYYEKNIKNKEFKDFIVFKGIEYDTLDAGHMIVIMPTGTWLPILELRGLPVSILIEIVHYHGGILGPAHPCGEKYLSLTNTRRGRRHKDLMSRFDFLETFNACEEPGSNHAASFLAREFDKPGVGGSDSHKIECTGLGYTLLPEAVSNETELIRCIKNLGTVKADGLPYLHTTKNKIGRINDLLIYSFWFYNKILALVKWPMRRPALLRCRQ